MPRDKKQRIATEAGPVLQSNPFAALAPGPWREGTDTSAPGPPAPEKEPKERLLLRRSTARRGGKTVLVLEGFSDSWNAAKLDALLRELKASLGCGGKVDGCTLEIQGDQPERLQPLLESLCFTVKRGW